MSTSSTQDTIEALHKEIVSMARTFEGMRKRSNTLFIWCAMLIVIFVTVGALMQGFAKDSLDTALFVAVASLVPSAALYQLLNTRYQKKTKKLFVKGLQKATGFRYKEDGVFPIRDSEPHKILPPHNRQRTEDGFEGEYKGNYVALQEIYLSDLKQDPQHKNREREFTIFWGLLIKISVRKPLSGHTVVIPHNAVQTFFRTRFSNFAPVKLVSKKFARIYDVMTTDQVEARVIMNPAFMEKFMESGEMTGAYWSEVSFNGPEIMVALQRFKPLFEMSPMWRPVSAERLRQSCGELEATFHLVDVLKLNPQIGL